MDKKTAKVIALRMAANIVNKLLDEGVVSDHLGADEKEEEKINSEIESIRDAIVKRAVKLGGEFNLYSLFDDEPENIHDNS